MRVLFLQIELKDETTEEDKIELLESIKKSNKLIMNIEKISIKRCNTPLYEIR